MTPNAAYLTYDCTAGKTGMRLLEPLSVKIPTTPIAAQSKHDFAFCSQPNSGSTPLKQLRVDLPVWVLNLSKSYQDARDCRSPICAHSGTFDTVVGKRLISLDCYFITNFTGDFQLTSHSECRWVEVQSLLDFDVAGPDLPVISALLVADRERQAR